MKKIIAVILLYIILYPLCINAQIQEWVATYNGVGAGSNAPKKCLTDKYGNIYVAGRSENSSFDDDFITLKYNSSGNLLWERRYNGLGNGDDAIAAAALDDSGNIYVTGYSQEGPTLGGYNWVTIKYFPNGDTAWKRSFNWTANSTDEPFAMAIDKHNNICISGYGRTAQPFDDDFITIKYNPDGIQQWVNVYASVFLNSDRSNSITVDDSCNVYPSGYGSTSNGNEIITIKYTTTGEEIWIRRFKTNYGDFLRHTLSAVDKHNNIIVNGYYHIGDNYAFNTIKYTSSGDLLWNRLYKGDGNLNFCFALCTDDSANVYAAGRSTNSVTGADFVTIKYNQYGDTMWIRNLDGGFNQADEVYSIIADKNQNLYVTGRSDSSDGLSDYMTLMYDSGGNIKWMKKYNGYSLVDRSFSINLDDDGSVVITGFTQRNAYDFWITSIKYSSITYIIKNKIDSNSRSMLFQNYPNPFNPITKISYELSESGYISLKVYDITGKEVQTLVKGNEFSGTYSTIFNGSNLSSGIYYYNLILNNTLINTKRMLLIK
jgi:Secretion system C-terminal sorting domain/Beta-propeller repeat